MIVIRQFRPEMHQRNGPKGKTWIGTSGLVLPGPKKTFPEQFQSVSRLSYYSHLFNTIEINSTFYKLHKAATFVKWSGETRKDFAFTVKLWKEITHKKNLEYREEDLNAFVRTLNFPTEKQGCLLIQFPASLRASGFHDVERLLKSLTQLLADQQWKLCVEFRDRGWYDDNTLAMLEHFNANLVYHDMAKSAPALNIARSKLIYLRFHGPEPRYRGTYTQDFLDEYAELILNWNTEGKDVFVYFNNTLGKAFDNARYLFEKTNTSSIDQ